MFFIVGRGRSGTTLLSYVLDSHPDLSVAPEAMLIMNLYSKYAGRLLTEAKVPQFLRDLWLERRLESDWKINGAALSDELISLCRGKGPLSFSEVCRVVFMHHASNCGKQPGVLLGDKNPHNTLFIPVLIRLFPEAKFVHIVRQCSENISSYKKVAFDSSDTAALALRWRMYNQSVLKQQVLFPQKFIRVQFETFISDPEGELRRICDFLGVAYDPRMREFHKDLSVNLPPWVAGVRSPIGMSNVRSRAESLPPRERDIAEALAYPVSGILGYAVPMNRRRTTVVLSSLQGVIRGWLLTLLERMLFLAVPLKVRSYILTRYRVSTGSLGKG